MKVALVNPPLLIQEGVPFAPVESIYEPLGLEYIASLLEVNGHQVYLVDCRFDKLGIKAVAEQLLAYSPDIIGIGMRFQSSDLLGGIGLVIELRRQGFTGHITTGGHTATFLYAPLLSTVDGLNSVCLGEGEQKMLELVNCLDKREDWRKTRGIAYCVGGRVCLRPPMPLIQDLDSLPWPRRDWLFTNRAEERLVLLESSRGCYANCAYCSVPGFYRSGGCGAKYRVRTPKKVVDEIEYLVQEAGVRQFMFVDDNFISPGHTGLKRVQTFVDEVTRRNLDFQFWIQARADSITKDTLEKLREVGLVHISIGIESGVESVLRRYRKGTTVAQNERALSIVQEMDGLECTANWIMFDPYTTMEELLENINFIKRTEAYRFIQPSFLGNTMSIYPGVPLRNRLLEDGIKLLPVGEGIGGINFSQHYFYRFPDERVQTVHKVISRLCSILNRVKGITINSMAGVAKEGNEIPLSRPRARLGSIFPQDQALNLLFFQLFDVIVKQVQAAKHPHDIERQLIVLGYHALQNWSERYLDGQLMDIIRRAHSSRDHRRNELAIAKEMIFTKDTSS